MSDDVSIAGSWSSDSEESLAPKGIQGQERRGRTKDRTRPKRKGESHSAGRASSIDFIRKVPVSPFHRDNNDQQHDSLERQRLNHTIRARSKSSSHAIAVHALFSNSAHSKPETKSKIKRNSSEPFFDTQIPVNYVRNLARRFQSQEVLKDDGDKAYNQNVVLVSMTETGDSNPRPIREADNQISYIEVSAEPPMSISSIDSDSSRDTGSSMERPRYQRESREHASQEAGMNNGDNGTDMCSAASVTSRHAICTSPESMPPASCQDPDTGPSGLKYRDDSAKHQDLVTRPYTNRNLATVKGISNDSSDSVEKPTPPLSSRTVRGRYKSYLRDTMQFSFHTGEKSASGSGQPFSSDDSVYLDSRDNVQPGSPIVSDVSTSGCSSGSDDQPRGRWTDGSCPSNLLSYSSPPQPQRNATTCQNSRGHVHTNGCYGQRQRSVSPDKRTRTTSPGNSSVGYAEIPPPPLSRSLPALPVMSPILSDMEGPAPSAQSLEPMKHPKDPKVILRAAHLSNELVRLTQLLERLHPQEVQHILLKRLRQRDSKAIVALGVVLPRTSFPSTEQVHCVRCHKNYDLRQSSACTLKHPAAYVVKTHQDSRGASFYCKACDGQFLLHGLFAYDEKINSYMAGFCFNGLHSTNPADVNFSGIVRTCEEQGCVECYV